MSKRRDPRRLLGVLAAAAVLCSGWVLQTPATADPQIEIIAESPDEVLFVVTTPRPGVVPIILAGERYDRLDLPGGDHVGRPGEPDLPSLEYLIALPPGRVAVPQLVEAAGETPIAGRPLPVARQDIRLVPGPAGERDEPMPRYELDYEEDPRIYGAAGAFPAQLVTLGEARNWRHYRVVPVQLTPLQFDPVAGEVRWFSRLLVRVRFVAAPEKSVPGDPGRRVPYLFDEPRWEPLFRQRILNHGSARAYRRRAAPTLAPAPQAPGSRLPRASGLEFRVTVDTTGLYRLAFADLTAAGLAQASLAWDELKLVVRGYDDEDDGAPLREWPVAFLPDDEDGDGFFEAGEGLIFYGQDAWSFFDYPLEEKRYGRGNVYWLIQGAGSGPQVTSADSWFDWEGLTPPIKYRRTVRFENNVYYGDIKLRDDLGSTWSGPWAFGTDHYVWSQPTARPVGTGIVSLKTVSFEMPKLLRALSVCVHLQGTFFVNSSSSPHRPRLWLSRAAAPEETTWAFPGNPYYVYSLDDGLACTTGSSIPRTVLSDRRNYVKIYVPIRGDGIDDIDGDRIGIDWVDVDFEGTFEIYDHRLQAPLTGFIGQQEFLIRNVSTEDLLVLDIQDPRAPERLALTAGQLSGDAGSGDYDLRLQLDCGDILTGSELLIVEDDAFDPLPVGAVTQRAGAPVDQFTGEDYVLVYSRRFAAEVAPLIGHREGQGHRVFAAAVEDLYDTYSGGRAHPYAIKRLMRRMWRGSTPPPDYLLLFGDASNDLGGYLLGTPDGLADTTYVPTMTIPGHTFGSTGTQLISSDSWFIDNLNGAWGDQMSFFPDAHVGRVSCGTREEAEIYVEKVIHYEESDLEGRWRNRLVVVSDDDFSSSLSGIGGSGTYERRAGEWRFLAISRDAVDYAASDSLFAHYSLDTLYLNTLMDSVPSLGRCKPDTVDPQECLRDANGDIVPVDVGTDIDFAPSKSYGAATVKELLKASLSRGALLWAYQGHSHSRQLSHEEIFRQSIVASIQDVEDLDNLDRPFVFHGYGCHLAEFASHREGDRWRGDAMVERMLFCCPGAPRGGIGAIASTDFETIGHDYEEKVFAAMFADPPADAQGRRRWRLGEIVSHSKVKLPLGLRERVTYMLLGDPALRHGISPPWITLELNDAMWEEESGAEYASDREDDSLFIALEISDEADVGLPELEDYYGSVPTERLDLEDPDREGRLQRLSYRTQVQRRPYSLRVRTVDYEGSTRGLEIRIPFHVAIYERLSQGLELLPDGADIRDTSHLALTVRSGAHVEPEDIRFLIDGTPLGIASAELSQSPGEPGTWTLRYGELPELAEGNVTLDVEIRQHDGEFLVLASQTNRVGVVPLRIAEAYWIPNPFEDRSHLVYRLTGPASRARLRVFTSSGREILKDESLPVDKGLRHFLWDGRDADGDQVANGLYFYELTIWDETGRRAGARILDKVIRVR